jgi:hypothetical protein
MPLNVLLPRRQLLTLVGTVLAGVTGGAIVRNTDVRADSSPPRGGEASVLYKRSASLATTDGDTGSIAVRGLSTIWVNILISAGTPLNPNPNANTISFQLDYFDALGNALPTPASEGVTLGPGNPFPQYVHFAAGPGTGGTPTFPVYPAPLPNSVRIRWLVNGNNATFSISMMGR